MTTALTTLDNIQVPAFLKNRASANTAFLAGLPQGGGFPSIRLSGTRFVVHADGNTTPLNTLQLPVVLVSAKPNLDKTYYVGKYDPNATETKSPDCFSCDAIKPDPSSPVKQCESCAGCPQNQFGSGTDQNGNPSKGKACSDTKMLAVWANNTVYGFKIPSASLKAFRTYASETSRRGVDLSTCLTVIGFDANFSYPVLTFDFGGWLSPEQVATVDGLKDSAEVEDVVGAGSVAHNTTTAPAELTRAAKAVEAPKPVDPPASADPFAALATATPAKPKIVKPKAEKPVEQALTAESDADLDALAMELGL